MSDPPDSAGEVAGPAGTRCALCGADLSPGEYPNCRAVLVDETATGGERESVRMVCADCLGELETELTGADDVRSEQSA